MTPNLYLGRRFSENEIIIKKLIDNNCTYNYNLFVRTRKEVYNMSPRKKSENSKRQRMELRLNDTELECISKIQNSLGLSKSGAILYALNVLELASINRDFRELANALLILKNLKEHQSSYDDIEGYEQKFNNQIRQVKYCFENFIETYTK